MEKDRNFLIDKYNTTSTDDGSGNIQTYESWLEENLLKRINENNFQLLNNNDKNYSILVKIAKEFTEQDLIIDSENGITSEVVSFIGGFNKALLGIH